MAAVIHTKTIGVHPGQSPMVLAEESVHLGRAPTLLSQLELYASGCDLLQQKSKCKEEVKAEGTRKSRMQTTSCI